MSHVPHVNESYPTYEFVMSRICMSHVPHMNETANSPLHMQLNTMQDTATHTATHCNTLQHTATHCNTLHHTATHCTTLQHTATHCTTLQHTTTHCNTLQHTATAREYIKSNPTQCSHLLNSITLRIQTLQHTRQLSATHTASAYNTHCNIQHLFGSVHCHILIHIYSHIFTSNLCH